MGAYSPARPQVWDEAKQKETMETVILPTMRAMEAEDCAYTGVLYAGLMMVKGKPYLIEYNVRFGDPECQPLMMRLESDLATLLYDAATQNLERWADKIKWHPQGAICVVMAAEGYPNSYAKNTSLMDYILWKLKVMKKYSTREQSAGTVTGFLLAGAFLVLVRLVRQSPRLEKKPII